MTEVLTDDQNKQLKERREGRRGGGFGRGGFGGFALPGQILATSLQEQLKLTDKQKKQLAELQKDLDGKLAKLLSADQNKQLKQMQDMAKGFPGGPPGPRQRSRTTPGLRQLPGPAHDAHGRARR